MKNVHEQTPGKERINPHPFAGHHIPEAHAALNDNERAYTEPRHFLAGHDDFLYAALLQLIPLEYPARPDFSEGLADVLLKQNDNNNEQ